MWYYYTNYYFNFEKYMSENKNEFETIDFQAEKTITWENNDSKNIFTDFNTDENLEKEMTKIKQKKDTFFYLNVSLKVLQGVFWIMFLSLIILGSYVFIQKSEDFVDKEYLAPVCSFFIWDIPYEWIWCSSISSLEKIVNDKISSLNLEQTKEIIKVLPVIYETESFLNTKEISFLLEKSENKLKTLDVLEKFDFFKNEFTWFEKKKLKCFELSINWKERTLSMKCEAYSASYSSEIIWFSWDKNAKWEYLSWTSISIANSFINFLEKNARKYFLVIEKQKSFESENIVWTDWYTNKTTFNLKLKINF